METFIAKQRLLNYTNNNFDAGIFEKFFLTPEV